MLEPATAWMVRLRYGDSAETKGTLSLDVDGLVFVDTRSLNTYRFPFQAVLKVRRVRGSSVLIVAHRDEDERIETAFYFSQPPPLEPAAPGTMPLPRTEVSDRPAGAFGAFRRTSRRRRQRENVRYLTTQGFGKKAVVQAWADEITARTARG